MGDSIVQALLRRCAECWDDSAGVDIGKDKLDALTTLGFLTKKSAGRHGNVYSFTDEAHAELDATHPPAVGVDVSEEMIRRIVRALVDWVRRDGDGEPDSETVAELSGVVTAALRTGGGE